MGQKEIDHSCLSSPTANVAGDDSACTFSFDSYIRETKNRHFPCGSWVCRNSKFVDNINHLGPIDFISRLRANDEAAWGCIKQYVVLPIFKQKKYGEMAWKKSVPFDDACAYIYEQAMMEDRIDKLREPEKLIAWMQGYVRKFIRSFYSDKEKRLVSIQVAFAKKFKKGEFGDRTIEDPVADIIDEAAERSRKESLGKDEKDIIQKAFHNLWKRDPLKAYVLMFRMKGILPTKDIQQICKVSSDAYVNKLIERAKDDMSVALTGKHSVKRVVRRKKECKTKMIFSQ